METLAKIVPFGVAKQASHKPSSKRVAPEAARQASHEPPPKTVPIGVARPESHKPCHSRPLIASHPQSLFQRCPRGRWAKVSRKVFGLCSKILRSLSRGF